MVGDQIRRIIGAPPGSVVMHQNVTVAEAIVLSCFPLRPPRFNAAGDPLPERAIARLGTTRFRHPSPLEAVAYSPDGHYIVSASVDGRTISMPPVLTTKNGAIRSPALTRTSPSSTRRSDQCDSIRAMCAGLSAGNITADRSGLISKDCDWTSAMTTDLTRACYGSCTALQSGSATSAL